MTRYERQLEYMKGDKVWVLGVDAYIGQTIERQGREISEIEKTMFGGRRKGVIFNTRTYLTKLRKGKEVYKCYRVEVEHGGIWNVSECMLERRND